MRVTPALSFETTVDLLHVTVPTFLPFPFRLSLLFLPLTKQAGGSRWRHTPHSDLKALSPSHLLALPSSPTIMADLEVEDPEINTKNLLRIKADITELVTKQDEIQRSIARLNAEIASKGPSVTLEGRLKRETEEQHSVCTRANVAMSVIGLSIEDLTESSRDPPIIMAIKDLLESLDTFTFETSIKILRKALVTIQDANPSSCTDILEDLESAFGSLSIDHISRSTKILQTTQIAVRDLATDPSSRCWARRSRFASISPSVSPSPLLQNIPEIGQSKASLQLSENSPSLRDVDQVLDTPSLHRYMNFVHTKFPIRRIAEALQRVVDEPALGYNSMNEHGPEDFKEVTPEWKTEMEKLDARVQALEEINGAMDSVEADKRVKEEEISMHTRVSPYSTKRLPPTSDYDIKVKRSRFSD